MRRALIGAALALAGALAPGAAAASITQTQCFQAPGEKHGCSAATGLEGAAAVAVAPDGRHVYVAGNVEQRGALLTYARDPQTGALTPQGCAAETARDGCTAAGSLFGANDVAVSADGQTVYVLGILPGSVGVFRRDPASGALTQVQCVEEGYQADDCARVPFENAWKFALTADGRSLIVAGSRVTRFSVGNDGLLTDAVEQRVSGVRNPVAIAVGPDPRAVFIAGGTSESGKLSVLRRDPQSGVLAAAGCTGDGTSTGRRCRRASGVRGPLDLAVAPDGRGVYLAASSFTSSDPFDPFGFSGVQNSSAVSLFSPRTGAQRACLLFAGRERERGRCRRAPRSRGPGFSGASAIAVSPDGRFAVAGFEKSRAVALLRRNRRNQRLSVVGGKGGCVRDPGKRARLPRGCTVGRGIHAPTDVAIAPDGRSAYVTSRGGLVGFALQP